MTSAFHSPLAICHSLFSPVSPQPQYPNAAFSYLKHNLTVTPPPPYFSTT